MKNQFYGERSEKSMCMREGGLGGVRGLCIGNAGGGQGL